MSITATTTETIAATLRSALETEADVLAAYLYGSVARGVHRSRSDVDVALLVDHDPPETFDGLRLDLAARLVDEPGRPVDVVILNKLPIYPPVCGPTGQDTPWRSREEPT